MNKHRNCISQQLLSFLGNKILYYSMQSWYPIEHDQISFNVSELNDSSNKVIFRVRFDVIHLHVYLSRDNKNKSSLWDLTKEWSPKNYVIPCYHCYIFLFRGEYARTEYQPSCKKGPHWINAKEIMIPAITRIDLDLIIAQDVLAQSR